MIQSRLTSMEEESVTAALNLLCKAANGEAKEAGWWDSRPVTSPLSIPTAIALMHSELSEALEAHRKGLMDDHLPHREGVEVEFADLLIRVFDTAGELGLDLGDAVIEKMHYNRHRADHKAKARAAEGGKKY